MSIEILTKAELDSKFQDQFRHYLVGNFPEASLKDKNIEVGISYYRESTADKPHYHPTVTEYQLVLSGQSIFYDLDANTQYTLNAGDFFIVHNNTRYAEKHKPDTKVLFFKYPGLNDKTLVSVDDNLAEWLENNNF